MDKSLVRRAIDVIIKRYPAVLPYLSDELKTYDYMVNNIARMVSNVYTNNMGGEFVDIMGALIRGQMRDAYRKAYAEAGFSDALPDWLQADLEEMQTQTASFDFIYKYYTSITSFHFPNVKSILSISIFRNRNVSDRH
jgi:hypothetical protein